MSTTTWWSQDQWRWCKRCGGLFYAGAFSACPHGGPHDGSTGGHYTLPMYAPPGVGQAPWLWCKGCGGAVFSAGSVSPCYGGAAHDTGGSGHYSVILR